MFGENPDAERADELKDDRRRHVLHTIHHPQRDPPERRADYDAAGDREQERRGNCREGEAVRGCGSDGQAVDQKRTGVVQQAFAFEDREYAMRRSQLPEHGGRGDGVGRSDYGAERNRRGPWHPGYECVGDEGDSGGRESNREDDQAGHGRPVIPEVPERCVVRRVEQDRCDEKRQRELGRKRERGSDWNKRQQRTTECKEHRVRGSRFARRCREDHGGNEEAKQLLELPHITGGDGRFLVSSVPVLIMFCSRSPCP